MRISGMSALGTCSGKLDPTPFGPALSEYQTYSTGARILRIVCRLQAPTHSRARTRPLGACDTVFPDSGHLSPGIEVKHL